MQKLYRPILTQYPERLDISSAWLGHLPFAFWVVDAVKPATLVELGTHGGVSYCTFCQAISFLKLNTAAYAVDTWEGDAHTGGYDNEIYGELQTYHDQRYSSFSKLIRTTFDEAVEKFADGSIDLLHIDGLHTYDAVSHDFNTWKTKLSDSAVVLFHDTNVYERDFGVQKLWQELSGSYPSFEFKHSHGLGVLAVGKQQSKAISWLTGLNDEHARFVRDHFTEMAKPLHRQAELQAANQGLTEELARIDGARHEAVQQQNTLAQLKQQLEHDVSHLNKTASEHLTTIDQQHQFIATKERDLSAKDQRIDALTNSLNSAELQQWELEKELEDSRQQIEEVSHHQRLLMSDLDAIKTSKSWRITRPVRWLAEKRNTSPSQPTATGSVYRTLRSPGGMKKAVSAVRNRGIKDSVARLRRQVSNARQGEQKLAENTRYDQWVKEYDTLLPQDVQQIKDHTQTLDYHPTISIALPVYNTPVGLLKECLLSVVNQTWQDWELCIADDASTSGETRELIKTFAETDKRIKYTFRDSNGGIALCTNSAFDLCAGEFIALLDHDDTLPPHALYMIAVELNKNPKLDLLFSDEDKIDEDGHRHDPHFKSDFNYELLLGQNCISHLGVYRASLIKELGGLREGVDGSQDHDLALRVVQHSDASRICHIPHILYHWRVFSSSGSFSTDNLDRAVTAGVKAVNDHLGDNSGAVAEPAGVGGFITTVWPLPRELPQVSVVIPTRDNAQLLENCVNGLLHNTDYNNLQIIIVDNGSKDPITLELLERLDEEDLVDVMPWDKPFNYSELNNYAVANTTSEYVCLLNDDIEVIDDKWLQEMMAQACRDDVGAVGARLLYADRTVQHGGVMLGVMGVANHLHKHLSVDSPGYFGRLQLAQELSGVTAACLLIKRSIYKEVGGLNEDRLSVAFNDVDFCLRVREAGYRNIWTPRATLYHLESASRGSDMDDDKYERFKTEVDYIQTRYGKKLKADPFYNLNLTLDNVTMDLAFPPRTQRPWKSLNAS